MLPISSSCDPRWRPFTFRKLHHRDVDPSHTKGHQPFTSCLRASTDSLLRKSCFITPLRSKRRSQILFFPDSSGKLREGTERPPLVEETFREQQTVSQMLWSCCSNQPTLTRSGRSEGTHPEACPPWPPRPSPPASSPCQKQGPPLLASAVWSGDPCRNQT